MRRAHFTVARQLAGAYLLAAPAAPEGDVLGDAPAEAADPELEPLAPLSDEPEDPLGLVEDEEGEDGEDGDGDGEVEGDAMEPEVPALPVEPDEPEVPPPIEEPDVPLAPAGGESVADLLHPAIAMVITLAARTILVALSIEFIVVPFIRIVYPSIQIPLTPSFWISFIQKFGVA
jgi:hypothetical protein